MEAVHRFQDKSVRQEVEDRMVWTISKDGLFLYSHKGRLFCMGSGVGKSGDIRSA